MEKTKSGRKISIDAIKTHYLISPVFEFGTTKIEITIDKKTQTASGKVLFCLSMELNRFNLFSIF